VWTIDQDQLRVSLRETLDLLDIDGKPILLVMDRVILVVRWTLSNAIPIDPLP